MAGTACHAPKGHPRVLIVDDRTVRDIVKIDLPAGNDLSAAKNHRNDRQTDDLLNTGGKHAKGCLYNRFEICKPILTPNGTPKCARFRRVARHAHSLQLPSFAACLTA